MEKWLERPTLDLNFPSSNLVSVLFFFNLIFKDIVIYEALRMVYLARYIWGLTYTIIDIIVYFKHGVAILAIRKNRFSFLPPKTAPRSSRYQD